jgi:monoamine oxidase
MVVFDATLLLLLLRSNVGRPIDSSGNPIVDIQERLNHLVQRLEARRTRIIIPTPALSEVLVHAGAAGPEILETLTRSTVFKVEPFDTKAAVEAALMAKAAIDSGDKRSGLAATWAKVKFDRQIVAIAKVFAVSAIYSDDADVRALAAAENIPVISLAELPLPPLKSQMEIPLAPPVEQPDLLSQEGEPSDIEEQPGDEPG